MSDNNKYIYKKDGLFLKIFEGILFILIIGLSYYVPLIIDLSQKYELRNFEALYTGFPWIAITSWIILAFNGAFNAIKKTTSEHIVIMFLSAVMINVTTMAIAFFTRGFGFPRSLIVTAFVIQVLLLSIFKCLFISLLRYMKGTRRVMVIADFEDKEDLTSKILSGIGKNDRIDFFVKPNDQVYLKYMNRVDKIFISDKIEGTVKDKIITHCITLDKSLYIVPKTFEIAILNSDIIQFSDLPTFKVDTLHLSREKMIIKRAFDLLVSLIGIIITSPVVLIVYLVILIKEGRPVFYTQERATIGNRTFKLVKFRSMVVNAESETGAIWAQENDPRVTKLGRFLRRFWLDELPQLFNVLKGDMSLVGPRPERPFFIDQFSESIPDFQYRLTVKAGVTGLAQVMGKYSTTPENKIKYDLMYIRNAGLLFDIKIVIETVKKILLGTLKRGENIELTYNQLKEEYGFIEKHTKDAIEFHYKYEK